MFHKYNPFQILIIVILPHLFCTLNIQFYEKYTLNILFIEFKAAVKPSLRFFAVCKTYTVSAGFKEFKFMRYTVFTKRVAQHYAVIVIDRTVILARPDKRRRKAPVCKLFNA